MSKRMPASEWIAKAHHLLHEYARKPGGYDQDRFDRTLALLRAEVDLPKKKKEERKVSR